MLQRTAMPRIRNLQVQSLFTLLVYAASFQHIKSCFLAYALSMVGGARFCTHDNQVSASNGRSPGAHGQREQAQHQLVHYIHLSLDLGTSFTLTRQVTTPCVGVHT